MIKTMTKVCENCGSFIEVGWTVKQDRGFIMLCSKCFHGTQIDTINVSINTEKPTSDKAKHFDDGKPKIQWLPYEAMCDIAAVFEYGAKKYGNLNYQEGMKWSKLIGSALRHLYSFMRREDKDPESGLSHLAHAGANIMMLLYYETHHRELDNRANGLE